MFRGVVQEAATAAKLGRVELRHATMTRNGPAATEQETALRELLAKSTDANVLREMIGFAAERLMELRVVRLTGAAHGERSPDRLVQRNGYRERN